MNVRIVRSDGWHFTNQTIFQPLMIALFVEMRTVLLDWTMQGALPYEDNRRLVFVLDRTCEELGKMSGGSWQYLRHSRPVVDRNVFDGGLGQAKES